MFSFQLNGYYLQRVCFSWRNANPANHQKPLKTKEILQACQKQQRRLGKFWHNLLCQC